MFTTFYLPLTRRLCVLVPVQSTKPGCVGVCAWGGQFRNALGVTLFWWDSTPGNPADTPGEKAGSELFLSESESSACGEPPKPGAPCGR